MALVKNWFASKIIWAELITGISAFIGVGLETINKIVEPDITLNFLGFLTIDNIQVIALVLSTIGSIFVIKWRKTTNTIIKRKAM